MNSRGVSQWNCPTTWSWMNATIVKPPPTVKAPTLKKYSPMSTRLCAFGIAGAPAGMRSDGNHRAITARTEIDETARTIAGRRE